MAFRKLLFALLLIHFYAYSNWDSSYKEPSSVHELSCCASCTPQYCIYVYCINTPSDRLLASPLDQCMCQDTGGVLRYEVGPYVESSNITQKNYSTDCVRGVVSDNVSNSNDKVASSLYDRYDLYCLNEKNSAQTNLGMGVGEVYCDAEKSSNIRHYLYGGHSKDNETYNHIYFCSDSSREFAWKEKSKKSKNTMCQNSTISGHAIFDIYGRMLASEGSSYTFTPTPSPTFISSDTPTSTATPLPPTQVPTIVQTQEPTSTPTYTPTVSPTMTPISVPVATLVYSDCLSEDGVDSGNHVVFVADEGLLSNDFQTSGSAFQEACTKSSQEASLSLEYVPIYSVSSLGVKADLELNEEVVISGGIRNRNNEVVATSWNDFFRQGHILMNLINYNSRNENVKGQRFFPITGIDQIQNDNVRRSCNFWSSSSSEYSYAYGSVESYTDYLVLDAIPCNEQPNGIPTVFCISTKPTCYQQRNNILPISEDGVDCGNHIVFVTSQAMLSDQFVIDSSKFQSACDNAAISASLRKKYVPVVSSEFNAKMLIEANVSFDPSGNIRNIHNEVVSLDWNSFWFGRLENAVKYNQYGVDEGMLSVVTGTSNINGNIGQNCNNWSSNNQMYFFSLGLSNSVDQYFTFEQNNCSNLNLRYSVYCISQKPACISD